MVWILLWFILWMYQFFLFTLWKKIPWHMKQFWGFKTKSKGIRIFRSRGRGQFRARVWTFLSWLLLHFQLFQLRLGSQWISLLKYERTLSLIYHHVTNRILIKTIFPIVWFQSCRFPTMNGDPHLYQRKQTKQSTYKDCCFIRQRLLYQLALTQYLEMNIKIIRGA